jgi:hypothetical protein
MAEDDDVVVVLEADTVALAQKLEPGLARALVA